MSQHDFLIDNQDGASFRADINGALQALATVSSGPAAPAAPYAYMLWADSTTGLLKQRNAGNTAWTTMATIGKSLVADDSSQVAKAWVNFTGTGTPAITRAFNVTSITDNGVGDYTLNFTTALADATYCITGSANNSSANLGAVCQPYTLAAPTAAAVRVQTPYVNGGLSDYPNVHVVIFR